MLYACGGEHKNNSSDYNQPSHNTGILWTSLTHGSLFGGTRGLPLEAHHPTGCTSGMQRLHQKSLLLSLSKPSYRRRALNPARHKKQLIIDLGDTSPQNLLSTPSHVFIISWGLLSCHGAVEVTSMSMWSYLRILRLMTNLYIYSSMTTEQTQSADEDWVIWLKGPEQAKRWTWSLDCFVNSIKLRKKQKTKKTVKGKFIK